MGRPFYSRRHYARLSNGGPDTPATIAERVAHRDASERAVKDREAKYPVLTSANFLEAMAYQEERTKFHKGAS